MIDRLAMTTDYAAGGYSKKRPCQSKQPCGASRAAVEPPAALPRPGAGGTLVGNGNRLPAARNL